MTTPIDSRTVQWQNAPSASGLRLLPTSGGWINAVVSAVQTLTPAQGNNPRWQLSLTIKEQTLSVITDQAFKPGTELALRLNPRTLTLELAMLPAPATSRVTQGTTEAGGKAAVNKTTAKAEPARSPVIEQALKAALPQQQSLRALAALLQTLLPTPDGNQIEPPAVQASTTQHGKLAPASAALNDKTPEPAALAPKNAATAKQPAGEITPAQSHATTNSANAPSSKLNSELPVAIQHALRKLLDSMPRPEQLQNPKQLRRAVSNSGIFLESKLARVQQLQQQHGPVAVLQRTAEHIASNDLKSQFNRLLQLLPATAVAPTDTGDSRPPLISSETYNLQSLMHSPRATSKATASADDQGVVLRQLGKQLLAALARTQLNQLDSLAPRAKNTAAKNAAANQWTLELPIVNPHHQDNLELRIESDQQTANNQAAATEKTWRVTMALDLHQLGKLQVQLTIIADSVAAVLWSEHSSTHRQVQTQLQSLRRGLEQAGVAVRQLDCFNGLPAQTSAQNTLLDTHT